MKKCTLILMVALTTASCKKEKEDSTTVNTETQADNATPLTDCLTLEGYYKSKNIDEKTEWLKKYGDSVCECTMEEAILVDHRVKGSIKEQKQRYVRKWGDIKSIIGSHGYDVYVNIDYKGDTITGLTLVDRYISDDETFRFSPVLFKTLAKKYAKDDNSEFHFSFAKLDQKSSGSLQPVVVIQVVTDPSATNSFEGNPYYDYSTDPKVIPTDNVPL